MTHADRPRRVSSTLRSTVRRTRTTLGRVAISATVGARERSCGQAPATCTVMVRRPRETVPSGAAAIIWTVCLPARDRQTPM